MTLPTVRPASKIFVTGATGFIGQHFLRELLDRSGPDDRILCLVREPLDATDGRVRSVLGDLAHVHEFADRIGDCDYVYHLAANAAYGSAIDYDAINYEPTLKLIEAARSAKLKNFVFLSTIGAVDRADDDTCRRPLNRESVPSPRSAYGRSKLKAEQALRDSGLPFTIIRPGWVYGKGMRANSHIHALVTMVERGSPLSSIGFRGRVSLIHVADLAAALCACRDNGAIIGQTYFAETEALGLGQIMRRIVHRRHGREPRQLAVPRCGFLIGRIQRWLPLTVSNLFVDYLCAEEPAFRTDFGIVEPIRFAEGVADVLEDSVERHGAWVVTGANSGIGLSVCRKLLDAGRTVVAVDRDTGRIGQLENARVLCCDLTDRAQLRELARELRPRRIRALINNAGVGFRGGVGSLDEKQIDQTIDTNVRAPLLLTQYLLKSLERDRSAIVNVASSVGYAPLPFMSVYAASKAFIVNWSESLNYELKQTNVVTTFSPSGTHTGFQPAAGVKVSREGRTLLRPDQVAERLIEAVHRQRSHVLIGLPTKFLLVLTSLLPRPQRAKVWGKLFESLR